MTIVITIIVTLFIHSLIGVIIYLATKQNEQALALWGGGIICLITNIVSGIYAVIRKAHHAKCFKSLLVDKDGNLYYCDSKYVENIMYDLPEYDELDLKFAREAVNKHTIDEGWKKSDCNKLGDSWTLSARYVPLKVCLAEGAKEIKI